MTDAKDVTPIIQKLREFVEDGNDGTFGTVAMHGSSVIGGLVSALLAEIDSLTRELDDARRDVAAMREMLATAFREGWNCGDWKEDRDNVSAREYDWNHSAVKAKADAALTQGDV
jgi:hypothetical protein